MKYTAIRQGKFWAVFDGKKIVVHECTKAQAITWARMFTESAAAEKKREVKCA